MTWATAYAAPRTARGILIFGILVIALSSLGIIAGIILTILFPVGAPYLLLMVIFCIVFASIGAIIILLRKKIAAYWERRETKDSHKEWSKKFR